MRIHCTTTFLDGRDRFEAGESLATESACGCRVITADQAERFTAAGWARWVDDTAAAAPDAESVTIAVQNGTHTQGAHHG